MKLFDLSVVSLVIGSCLLTCGCSKDPAEPPERRSPVVQPMNIPKNVDKTAEKETE